MERKPMHLGDVYGEEFLATDPEDLRVLASSFMSAIDIEAEIRKERTQHVVAREHLRKVGLDERSIQKASRDLQSRIDGLGLAGTRTWTGRALDDDNIASHVRACAPLLPLLKTLWKGFDNLKVIEVGTDVVGLGTLSYLQQKGAYAAGVDVNPRLKDVADRIQVPFIQGRLENLDGALQNNGFGLADVVMTNFMTDEPWEGGVVDRYSFDEVAAESISRSLTADGMYINNSSLFDLKISRDAMYEHGFSTFYLKMADTWQLTVFQRQQ